MMDCSRRTLAACVACRHAPIALLARIASSVLLLALTLAGTPGQAVLIASGDGTGNVTPPADDPGFAHVGIMSGLSVVYLGNGWVITASHVGLSDVTLGASLYPIVPGSRTILSGPGGPSPDLAVIKIAGDPGLPTLNIATAPPPVGADIVLAGHGKDRGTALSWQGKDGWNWGSPFTLRWGTNRITDSGLIVFDTLSFQMNFDPIGQPASTPDEAQATLGDSGGAVFWKTGGQWYLAGTLFATTVFNNQPAKTALYDNTTVAADLSFYRSQILALSTVPACSDGLDDDLDGLTDYPADPGCDTADDPSERSAALQCDDGLDNDGDGKIDFPADPQCLSPLTPSEAVTVSLLAPGSIGALAAVLAVLGSLRANWGETQSRRRTRKFPRRSSKSSSI